MTMAVFTAEDALESFSIDDVNGNGNGRASNEEFDWLNEEKKGCCTCSTHFRTIPCRHSQNNNLKLPRF